MEGKNSQTCAADDIYLQNLVQSNFVRRVDADYTCFIDIDEFRNNKSKYQLIDIDPSGSQIESLNQPIWKITPRELKNISSLQAQNLLLLGRGFSRAEIASHCAELKAAGFKKVKALINGKPALSTFLNKNALHNIGILADDFLYEIAQSEVIVITDSIKIENELRLIGVQQISRVSNFEEASVNAVLGTHLTSLNPIVYVSDKEVDQSSAYNIIVYHIKGGYPALVEQVIKNKAMHISKQQTQARGICAK